MSRFPPKTTKKRADKKNVFGFRVCSTLQIDVFLFLGVLVVFSVGTGSKICESYCRYTQTTPIRAKEL